MTDDGRPQDQGRPHRRRGAPSAATTALLARYQDSMRTALAGALDDLAGRADPQTTLDGSPIVKVPALGDRIKLWDLAIKLGRELGTEIDPGPDPKTEAPPAAPRRRRRVDFG